MVEIYPVAVLTASQQKNMLGQWKRTKGYIKSTSPSYTGVLSHVMTTRFFKDFIPRTLHDLVFDLSHRRLQMKNIKFTYHMKHVRRLDQPWTHVQDAYDLLFMINLSGCTNIQGHFSFPCFPELRGSIKAGRLFVIPRGMVLRELPNLRSTPRTYLTIGASQ